METKTETRTKKWTGFKVGERVEVLTSPLIGQIGEIEKANLTSHGITYLVRLRSETNPVEIAAKYLSRVPEGNRGLGVYQIDYTLRAHEPPFYTKADNRLFVRAQDLFAAKQAGEDYFNRSYWNQPATLENGAFVDASRADEVVINSVAKVPEGSDIPVSSSTSWIHSLFRYDSVLKMYRVKGEDLVPGGVKWGFGEVKVDEGDWDDFLMAHKFEEVDESIEAGKRNYADYEKDQAKVIYKNPDGIYLYVEHRGVPEGNGNERYIGNVRFEAPPEKDDRLWYILKDFRGEEELTHPWYRPPDIKAAATHINGESPERAYFM